MRRFTEWLARRQRRNAARKLARVLPKLMLQGWGASEFYTVGQVRSALRTAGIEGPYGVIAFAGLLSEENFRANPMDDLGLSYGEARELFEASLPDGSWTAYFQQPIASEESVRRHGIGW